MYRDYSSLNWEIDRTVLSYSTSLFNLADYNKMNKLENWKIVRGEFAVIGIYTSSCLHPYWLHPSPLIILWSSLYFGKSNTQWSPIQVSYVWIGEWYKFHFDITINFHWYITFHYVWGPLILCPDLSKTHPGMIR